MSNGPAASPSSQMVTRRVEVDEEPWRPSRSSTMLEAIGTTEMHVKVLNVYQPESNVSSLRTWLELLG